MWTSLIVLTTALFFLLLPRPRMPHMLVGALGGAAVTLICLSPISGVGFWPALKTAGITLLGVHALKLLARTLNASELLRSFVRPWSL